MFAITETIFHSMYRLRSSMSQSIHLHLSELEPKVPARLKFQKRRRLAKIPSKGTAAADGQPWKTLLNEFLEGSSIHGLAQFSKKELNFSEIILWAIVLAIAILGTLYIGRQSWRRYQHFPTVISMEKDYKNWNTTFAMATVCPEIKIDERTLRSLALKYKAVDIEGFVQFFKMLAGASYESFDLLPEYKEIDPDNFLQIIVEAKYNFSFELSNSQDIDQDLLLMVTENNLCYGFNTHVGVYFSTENFNKKQPMERRNNLINGSPLDGEVFVQIMNMSSGYNVSLTGPYDMPDVSVRRFYSESRYYLLLDITALSIVSSDNVRSLSPEQRKCRFFDESVLELSEIYSYNLCRMQCRANLAFELCKCIPYFYQKSSHQRPYCRAEGMRCLGKHEGYLTNLRDPETNRKIPCGCLPLCNDVHYLIELETHLQWAKATNMKFSMVHYPRMRLRREVIFGFADLLVSIGGTAGFFLGCSVLSFIEIVYYLTLRLFFYMNNYVKTQPFRKGPVSRKPPETYFLGRTLATDRIIWRN